MKHAYLIIAHGNWTLLNVLLKMLDDNRNDIYLHVDKRINLSQVDLYQPTMSSLFILEKRYCGYWGSTNLMKIEYALMDEAIRHDQYDYYHLLSGQDLPIKTTNYIDDFFKNNAGKEFIHFCNITERERRDKMELFHLLKHKSGFNERTNYYDYVIGGGLSKIGIKRRINFELCKGSQWFSITHGCLLFLLSNRKKNLRRFFASSCSDEFFIQTTVNDSPFRNNLYCCEDNQPSNLRLIDWNRGCPYVWTEQDMQEIKQTDCLFARKISLNDSLSQMILEEYNN